MDYKVIDNFLDKVFFEDFKKKIFLDECPWYWRNNTTSYHKDDPFYFTHSFYNNSQITSPLFNEYIVTILDKLDCFIPIQIRANLYTNQNKKVNSSFHIDYTLKQGKTAILYMNTCESETVLFKNKKIKIKSKENRILIFDSLIEHSVIINTDVPRRIIINFNYFENKILN
jgi:hypothetical protein